ncbi:haloacid dehalogenase-like hydrolase [Schizosaccharomyces japonicus yFS275]|uniref:Haloacid dehalogenase-like hydrolase n=1 Tax=Schizosaccharomyces japonicus (strain yFS275 / FY16936) TaxID=402676 RepID=B6K6D5_SCHJY|nr:haloacid dehalogenase-like hydrolase [Schizosaccharomyces japonicus yFS275]EEB09089.1 haloacid dehalogenase-like hydrolase [Schizosaccharomyces japonicus yFS275]
MKTKACLFDMDGLLIDSEAVYTESTNIILKRYNKGPFSMKVKAQMMGRPGPSAARLFLDWSGIPMEPTEYLMEQRVVQREMWSRVQPLPGALELLKSLEQLDVPAAVATSSDTHNFQLKTAHLPHLFTWFKGKIIRGDDPRLGPGRGKPAPDIWFEALKMINEEQMASGKPEIKPEECLVFEDSLMGVQSALAANMKVVWVPDPLILPHFSVPEEIASHPDVITLNSLAEVDITSF